MRIANPFRYQFKEPAKAGPCIYRLWFGKKYFIGMGKSIYQTVNSMSVEIDRRLRLGILDDHRYYNIVKYIKRARIIMFDVEIILSSDRPLDLLKKEHAELKKASKDADCLNATFDVYLPAWVSEKDKQEFTNWANPKKITKNAAKDNKTVSPRGNNAKGASVSAPKRRSGEVGRKEKNTSSIKEKPKRNSKK